MDTAIMPFEFQGKQFRTARVNDQVVFIAKDVCVSIELSDIPQAIARIDDDEKGMVVVPTPGGRQKMTYVTESGMYELIFMSRKPEAKAFKKWVTKEVLPSIRKTGKYVFGEHTPTKDHLLVPVQKNNSKRVNAKNYTEGGKEEIVRYNRESCKHFTGREPHEVIAIGKRMGLKSKDTSSSKAVLRVTNPELACAMSVADDVVSCGGDIRTALEVSGLTTEYFRRMIELGFTPAELYQ